MGDRRTRRHRGRGEHSDLDRHRRLGGAGGRRPPPGRRLTGSDAEPATLQFAVVTPDKPTLVPVKLDGIKQGTTAKIDVAAYLSSPLRDPQVTVVGVEPRERAAGSKIEKVRQHGLDHSAQLDLRRTDLRPAGRRRRRHDPNGPPGDVEPSRCRCTAARTHLCRVQATAKGQSRTATVSWRAGGDNGAPITEYRVKSSTGVTQTCAASPCQIRGLKNGVWVTFTVEARNKAGWSEVSESTDRVRPDAPPPAVIGLRAGKPATTI